MSVDPTKLTAYTESLYRSVSVERLETYRSPNGDEFDMLVNYFWNLELSQSLYLAIAAFEVALRNTVHVALMSAHQSPAWYEDRHLLEQREQDEIESVRLELRRNRKEVTDGRIVAGLRFVFWEWIFNRPYESRIWHRNRLELLRSAFPNLPTGFRSRQSVEQRCREVRRLRNRIAHNEPVWNRPQLQEEHRNIVRAIRWISIPMETTIQRFDRFDAVYANGRERIAGNLISVIDSTS